MIRLPALLVRAGWPRDTRSRVAALAQRLPIFTHMLMVSLVIYGPSYAPHAIAFAFLATHLVFVTSQMRLGYGMIQCFLGARAHVRTNWWSYYLQKLREADEPTASPDDLATLQHIIIIPSYKEEYSTLYETLSILASHPLAKAAYKVVLAMEEREAEAKAKGSRLRAQFEGKFADCIITIHPAGMRGELSGKGSNVRWAARWVVERECTAAAALRSSSGYPDSEEHLPEAIITVMDADTAFAADYFLAASVRYLLATPEKRRNMMFVTPLMFDRNQSSVCAVTRVTDTFWAGAGIGGIYPGSSGKIPTSAYSVSLALAVNVGFWDAGAEAIGEDMHMFCKAQLDTKGNLCSETIYSPASVCNVEGERSKSGNDSFFTSFSSDMGARWNQAIRHMWGSLSTGYVITRLLLLDLGVSPGRALQHRANRQAMRRTLQASQTGYGDDEEDDIADAKLALKKRLAAVEQEQQQQYMNRNFDETYDNSAVFSAPHRLSRAASVASSSIITGSGSTGPSTPVESDSETSYSSYFETREKSELRSLKHRNISSTTTTTTTNSSRYRRSDIDSTSPKFVPIFTLCMRLYEAHFMIAHLAILVIGLNIVPKLLVAAGAASHIHSDGLLFPEGVALSELLRWSLERENVLEFSMTLSSRLGLLGVLSTIVMIVFYELFHRDSCARWDPVARAAIVDRLTNHASESKEDAEYLGSEPPAPFDVLNLGIRPTLHSPRRMPWALLDYLALPGSLFLGLTPLIYAQICHIWTDKLVYRVSSKPAIAVPFSDGQSPSGKSVEQTV